MFDGYMVYRMGLPTVGVIVAIVAAALFVEPIGQDPAFHDFADQRGIFGVPNFWNVTTNLAFAAVGLWGLARLARPPSQDRLEPWALRLTAAVFCIAVGLVAIGSTYYHWNPNNQTLFWDRLPMTAAFVAVLAIYLVDRVHPTGGLYALPVLILLGIASLVYWRTTGTNGQDDLRFYFLMQLLPIVMVPSICLWFAGRHTTMRHAGYAVLAYGGAMVCEQLDDEIYAVTGKLISGHSIKHVLAAGAVLMVLTMLTRIRPGADIARNAQS